MSGGGDDASSNNPTYADTLSSLFQSTNRTNSKAPTKLDFPSTTSSILPPALVVTAAAPSPAPGSSNLDLSTISYGDNAFSTSTITTSAAAAAASTTTTISSSGTTTTLSSINNELIPSSSDFPLPYPLVSDSQRLILTIFLFLLVLVGIVGNSFTIHLLLTRSSLQLRTHLWNITTFNLAMVDLIANILHFKTLLVHGGSLLVFDQGASYREAGGGGTGGYAYAPLTLESSTRGQEQGAAAAPAAASQKRSSDDSPDFFCKFQFILNFTCFVVPIWVLVVGLVERLLAQGWSLQYHDLLSFKKLNVYFFGCWFIGVGAAIYSVIPQGWVVYNPITTFCILNLQNPIGFPWFMLCFFYFLILPTVLIIPLIIFILSDSEPEFPPPPPLGGGSQQLPITVRSMPAPFPPPAGLGQQPPRIQISEINSSVLSHWHSRHSSCSEEDEEEGATTASGRGAAVGGGRTNECDPFWVRCWAYIKSLNCVGGTASTPVESVNPTPAQPSAAGAAAPLTTTRRFLRSTPRAAPTGGGAPVDPYGGRLFAMTQQQRTLRSSHSREEINLTNREILRSVLAALASFVLFKCPTGALAICKMFAMNKASLTVSTDYAYAEFVTLVLYFVGCSINPFIYPVLRTDMKYAALKCWKSFVDIYL